MKKTLMTLLMLSSFSIIGFANNVNPETKKVNNENAEVKAESYTIRLGLLGLDGSKRLSGWEDLGGFYATNLETGEVFYNEQGTFLPGIILDLPAGTYEFSALQGQGGWVGYGSVTVNLSEDLIDQEGYITVYVPIAWAE